MVNISHLLDLRSGKQRVIVCQEKELGLPDWGPGWSRVRWSLRANDYKR